MNFRLIQISVLLLASLLSASSLFAHDVELTRVRLTVRADRSFTVDVYYDVRAHLAGVTPEHLTEQDIAALEALPADETNLRISELLDFSKRRLRIYVEGEKTPFDVSVAEVDPLGEPLPVPAPASQATSSHASPITRILRLSGRADVDAAGVVFWASKSFGNIVLEVYSEDNRQVGQQFFEKGARSQPVSFAQQQAELSGWQVARDYVILGFEHILPEGLDHILFVLGLFLLTTKIGPLLWQVTAFTIAHSVTLALSTYGVVRLSSSIVEPLIALSIAYVAIENICTRKLHVWRPVIVFLFGLLHGLGFAGVLEELGLPANRFFGALVSFNVGVELGQITVILLAFLAVGWMRNEPWYRTRVVIPASAVIALVGLFWSGERLGFWE